MRIAVPRMLIDGFSPRYAIAYGVGWTTYSVYRAFHYASGTIDRKLCFAAAFLCLAFALSQIACSLAFIRRARRQGWQVHYGDILQIGTYISRAAIRAIPPKGSFLSDPSKPSAPLEIMNLLAVVKECMTSEPVEQPSKF